MNERSSSLRPPSFEQKIWSWIAENILLPAGDEIYGQPMMQHLRFLREAQWWDREQIEEYRIQRMRELIKTVFNEVPFYRQLMSVAKLTPEDFKQIDDLKKLPVVTKAMLRANSPVDVIRPTGQKTYYACSSGSTGEPFCVLEDWHTAGIYRASFLLALEWAGWDIGMPHVQTGMTLSRGRGRILKDLILRCHYVSAYDLKDDHLDKILEVIERKRICFLFGYPGSIYYLALRAIERGWNLPLKAVVTWGDTLYAQYRKTIENAFQTRVFDQYGCGEGIMISAQCDAGSHYHIFSPDVIVEYITDDNQTAPDGKSGNLIVTRLHPGPMPLVRYKVGDIGVSGHNHNCPCGRNFEIMDSIVGRETDIVLTPSGNRLIVHFFTGILEHFSEIDTFQVIQEKQEMISLYIKPRMGVEIGGGIIEEIINQLKQHGADIDIYVETVNDIPLQPTGKRRFIINKLTNSLSSSAGS